MFEVPSVKVVPVVYVNIYPDLPKCAKNVDRYTLCFRINATILCTLQVQFRAHLIICVTSSLSPHVQALRTLSAWQVPILWLDTDASGSNEIQAASHCLE